MEHEQEIENLKKRISTLEYAQVQVWRTLGGGALAALVVAVAALPPHLIRWGVIALVVVVVARYCPFIADAIRRQMHKSFGLDTTNASSAM